MVFNVPGVLVAFNALVRPRILLPSLAVQDIRHLDFVALRRAGYRGAVFDKDNCLTLPHKDALVPELRDAWQECRQVFGKGNVLIVSNSAGTRRDYGDIQSESVSHHLSVPVLRHGALKPAHACVAGVRAYFGSLPTPVRASELLVVGDRVFTDVVLAHRLRAADARDRAAAAKSHAADGKEAAVLAGGAAPGTLAVWTTGVWTRESTLMRAGERALVRLVRRFAVGAAEARARETLVREFVRTPPSVVEPARRRAWFAWPRRVFG